VEFLLDDKWMSKLAYLVDTFFHLNKLNRVAYRGFAQISAGVLHKYLCAEKQDTAFKQNLPSGIALCRREIRRNSRL